MEKGNYLSDPEISSEVQKVISEDMEIAETFNKFFVNIVPTLNILPKEKDVGNDNMAILNYINKFKKLSEHQNYKI